MDKAKSLRGAEIMLWRAVQSPKSLLKASVQYVLVEPSRLPKAPDVCAFVERLWGLPANCLERPEESGDLCDLKKVTEDTEAAKLCPGFSFAAEVAKRAFIPPG